MRKGFDNCEPSSGLPPRGSSRIGGLAVQAAITARVPRLAMQRITGRLKPAIKAASSRRCRVEKLMDIVTTLLFRDVCDQRDGGAVGDGRCVKPARPGPPHRAHRE